MNALRLITRSFRGLLLAGLLLGAQVGALAHAFEHDPGTAQLNACAACVTVAQLGSAATGTPAELDLVHQRVAAPHAERWSLAPASRTTARQRGPPDLLPNPR